MLLVRRFVSLVTLIAAVGARAATFEELATQAAAAREAGQAAAFQVTSQDSRVAGGFLFGRKCGEPMPFVNPVSTAFCVQALAWWDDRKSNALQARRQLLI